MVYLSSGIHELFHDVISNFCPSLLETFYEVLQHPNAPRFELRSQQLTSSILLCHLRYLLIVIQEECKVLISHIYGCISTQPTMLFLSLFSSAESVSVDLVLNLIWSIGHEDRRIGITCRHLRLRSLQGREKLGMDKCRFAILYFLGNIPC